MNFFKLNLGFKIIFLGLSLLFAGFWFLRNIILPDLYKGIICCDSSWYISQADRLHGLREVFSFKHPDWTVAFPLYLKSIKLLVSTVTNENWLLISLLFALALHFFSCLLFFHSRKKFADYYFVAFCLSISNPLLVAFAALPLTDSLANSLMLILHSLIVIRSSRPYWSGITIGLISGYVLLLRPSLLLAVFSVLVVLLLQNFSLFSKFKKSLPKFLALSSIHIFSFIFVIVPFAAECTLSQKHLCLTTKSWSEKFIQHSAFNASGVQLYSWVTPGGNSMEITKDEFISSHYACLQNDSASKILLCHLRSFYLLPVFLFKKSVALTDNFHLNEYAYFVNTSLDTLIGRLFSIPVYLGLIGMLFSYFINIRFLKLNFPLYIYCLVYFVTHVLSLSGPRLGIGLVVPSIYFIVDYLNYVKSHPKQGIGKIWTYAIMIVFITLFLLQAFSWKGI